jgi:hypothetical protein
MRKLLLAGSLVLVASLTAPAVPPAPSPGPGAIAEMLKGLFQAIDAGDRAAAKACLVDKDVKFPVLVYDLDVRNRPVTVEGLDGAHKYLDEIFDTLQKESLKAKSRITKIHADCHSPKLGYATLEFTQQFTGGGQTETHAYRATVLVSWGKDQSKGPKIFHWHGSLDRQPVAVKAEEAEGKKK